MTNSVILQLAMILIPTDKYHQHYYQWRLVMTNRHFIPAITVIVQ